VEFAGLIRWKDRTNQLPEPARISPPASRQKRKKQGNKKASEAISRNHGKNWRGREKVGAGWRGRGLNPARRWRAGGKFHDSLLAGRAKMVQLS
jgi:hypothetical protein